jgi:hypothetical protein
MVPEVVVPLVEEELSAEAELAEVTLESAVSMLEEVSEALPSDCEA